MNRMLVPGLTFVAGLLLGTSVSAFTAIRADAGQSGPLVTGVGGVFFKARHAEELRDWYASHLGFEPGPEGVTFLWRDKDDPDRVGRTVWGVFPHDTDYFGAAKQQFMLNYRVSDLDALLARLREEGIQTVKDLEEYSYGRFAWIQDAEGNRIELWEPPAGF